MISTARRVPILLGSLLALAAVAVLMSASAARCRSAQLVSDDGGEPAVRGVG